MTRAAISNFPGKHCEGPVANMSHEQYRLHSIYRRAYNKYYLAINNNKERIKKHNRERVIRKRFEFIGPLRICNALKNVKGWNGPPKPKPKKIRSKEYNRRKMKKRIDRLSDSYVKTCICKLVPGLSRQNITPELINLKRQQLKLRRICYEKRQTA